MKKIILILLTALFILPLLKFTSPIQKNIGDGFYLVDKFGNDSTRFDSLTANEMIVYYDPTFAENYPQDFSKLVIDTSDHVPLILEKLPVTEQDTPLKKKLFISLTPEGAAKMKSFTEQRLMKSVAVVLDGKVLTVHKIKAVITGGQIQITRCSDNACEYLFVKLKGKVKK